MRHHAFTVGLLLLGAGCGKSDDTGTVPVDTPEPYVPDYDDSNCRGDFVWTSWEERSDNGTVDFTLELPEGRSFQMTVEARQDDIVTMASQVTHPSGAVAYTWNDWNNTSQNYTYAAYPETAVSTLNYPVRASDMPYEAGTWLIEFFTLDRTGDYIDGVPVSIWLYVAEDDSLETGCVYVDVSYADGVSADEAVTDAVEAAFARWNQIWLDYGLKVIPLSIRSAAIDADAPSPQAGDAVYDKLSRSDEPILQLVVAESISGEAALGEAGSIPGSLASTPHAAVTLSWLQHAGTDGVLDAQDVQTMGETMAHEASHFLGLFHPVEFSDGVATSYDALGDTPSCDSRDDCDDSLEANLMYPYATGSVQDVLTEEQVGVLQRWTGVQ
ncbi:MAG: hypothetical protein P8R54_11015 [Myxococcota bacterium]|nr:hypothetical protein [Myxococcota bacterium]